MHLFPLTISTAVSTVSPVSMCVYDSDQCSRLLISPICSSNRFDPAPREARQDSCLLEAKKTAQKHRQTSQPWSAVRNINSMDLLCGSSTSGVLCVCVCDVVQVSKKQRYFMLLLFFFKCPLVLCQYKGNDLISESSERHWITFIKLHSLHHQLPCIFT